MLKIFRISFFLSGLLIWSCARPVARFSYSGEEKAPADIQFENESEKAESFFWDFGDGSTSEGTTPSHRYRSSGTYVVELTATKGNASRTATRTIQVKAPDKCLVEIETPYGTMLVELSDKTPLHRDNFLKLAAEGFYDSLLFHRVINGFMIQGGDPDSKGAKEGQALGMGGPAYTLEAEIQEELIHTRGALAAARKGDQVNPEKRSSGSQFYIVHGREVDEQALDQVEARSGKRYGTPQRQAYLESGGTPFLDHEYTVFGQVIEGLAVIDSIAAVTTDPRNRPKEDIPMKVKVIN